MAGIVSYGFYVPQNRIKTEEIAVHWGKNPDDVKNSLHIDEKAVAGYDEDALTMAYESASMALSDFGDRKKIGGVFVGSESHPYVVNPTSTTLAEYLGIGNEYLAYDTQFACKAATGVFISGVSLVKSDMAEYVLVSATDKATGRTGDALEYSAGSASASFVIGKKNVILEFVDAVSFSSDTPDFWRRHGRIFPSHAGRFTGKPGYFFHVESAVRLLFKTKKYKPSDFAYVIFHMPNGKFPQRAAKNLGFSEKQIEKSLVVKVLGNSYAASSFMGLCSVLDTARKDDLILLVSYGSGAGSDAIVLRATHLLTRKRRNMQKQLSRKKYISYTEYLRMMEFLYTKD